jgi:hypothetical protein
MQLLTTFGSGYTTLVDTIVYILQQFNASSSNNITTSSVAVAMEQVVVIQSN